MAKNTSTFTPPRVRHPYERVRVTTTFSGKSMTHQSHAESCDINNIIRKFDRTGVLPPSTRPEQYADVTGLQGDLTERINTSREILDKAGRAVEQKREEVKKKAAERQQDLETEIARLKAENETLVKGKSGAERTEGS